MGIDVDVRGDVCILRPDGRFVTGSNTAYVRARVEFDSSGCRKVIVDCRQTPYLDSTGLSFVVGLYNHVNRFGGDLVLAHANTRIREVLKIAKLEGIIPVFDDPQAALEELNGDTVPMRAASAV